MQKNEKSNAMLVLLTGGIASGKTLVSDYLGAKGAIVIDTDIISRMLTRIDNPLGITVLSEIKMHFGAEFFTDTGEMDRAKMRAEVFNNPDSKMKLESILHRRIYQEVRREIDLLAPGQYALIVVPVITEDSLYVKLVDEVLVVEVYEAEQLQRVMVRDTIDQELAAKIIHSQIARLDRRKLGDYIIISQNRQFVERQLDKLHDYYLKKAIEKSNLNISGE